MSEELADSISALSAYLQKLIETEPATEQTYLYSHQVRFHETLGRFFDEFSHSRGGRVLCLGGTSYFERWLADYFDWEMDVYAQDLRLNFNYASHSVDLILMLEVIEHLFDPPSNEIPTEFNFEGIRSCLDECQRVLVPGGNLIITTPNSISVDCIGQALLGMPPQQYEPHARELTPSELQEFVEQARMNVTHFSTAFVWNSRPGVSRSQLLEDLEKLGYDMTDRGDDMFLAAAT